MKLTGIRATAAAVLATSVAVADDGISEFRTGILGGENASDRLRATTEDLPGVPARLFPPADRNGVHRRPARRHPDMAWLGAPGYAKVRLTDADAVVPVLTGISADGSSGYDPIGFARIDSGIASLSDIKGGGSASATRTRPRATSFPRSKSRRPAAT